MLYIGNSRSTERLFADLYKKHSAAVFKNILKFVKDTHKAEDILQEVFLLLHLHLPQLKDTANVQGWLFVVSYHKSLQHLKQQVKKSLQLVADITLLDSVADDTEPDEEAAYMAQTLLLADAVELLSNRKKQVFKLIKYENYSVDEVAESMGISHSSVNNYLSQAIYDVKALIRRKGLSHSLPVAAIISFLNT